MLQAIGRLEDDFYASLDAARQAVRLRTMFNVIHFDTGFKVDLVIKKARPFSDLELQRRLFGELAGFDRRDEDPLFLTVGLFLRKVLELISLPVEGGSSGTARYGRRCLSGL